MQRGGRRVYFGLVGHADGGAVVVNQDNLFHSGLAGRGIVHTGYLPIFPSHPEMCMLPLYIAARWMMLRAMDGKINPWNGSTSHQ